MKLFISGGCKNGKSLYAQKYALHLAKEQSVHLYYIATMQPVDPEDDERIERHRQERSGWGFTTVEQPVNIEKILDTCNHNGSFLLDSLTALLANEMFPNNSVVNYHAAEKISHGLLQIFSAVKNMVIVSDYIYSDSIIYDQLTEKYRRSLALIDRVAAQNADTVIEIAYTNVIVHKGNLPCIL